MNFPIEKKYLSESRLLILLASVQFVQITDFMIMMPLGPQLMRQLGISAQQFGILVSSFALTAGLIGLAAAPFIDRFDRRKLLLVCFAGFTLSTLACGLANHATALVWARAVCGAFSGVGGATIMAIVADVVPPERRARGMGIIMTAFSVAAALGVPLGLKVAQIWHWQTPFLILTGLGSLLWFCIFRFLPPVRAHLSGGQIRSAKDFIDIVRNRNAWMGILLMSTMVFGHFTLIPYLSPFLVENIKLPEKNLFLFYLTGGIVSFFTGPIIGRIADRYGRFRIYCILIVVACFTMRFLTASGPLQLWQALILAGFFFTFASGRFVPGQAAISLAVPSNRRGAYMSLAACSRDLACGITTWLGGHVIVQEMGGQIIHYERLGWFAIGVSICSLWVFHQVKSVES